MKNNDIRNYHGALAWLKTLDRTLPIGEWRAGDVDFWPLARALMGTFLHEQLRKTESESLVTPATPPHIAHLAALQKTTRPYRTTNWRGHIRETDTLRPAKDGAELSLDKGDIRLLNANRLPKALFPGMRGRRRWLFVSNTNLDQPIGGQIVNRLFSPIITEARRWGVETCEIVSTPVAADHSSSRPDLYGIADSLWWLRVRSRRAAAPISMPGLAEFMLRIEGTPLYARLANGTLETAARTLAVYTAAFAKLIKQESISAVFVVPYHSQVGVAFCAAARACSIPVVDIQHGGIIGSPNPHYDIDKDTTFNSVPTHIWLWNARAVNTPRLGPDCRSFVGGNPTYSMVRGLRRSHPEWRVRTGHYEKEILVTLPRALLPNMLSQLVEMSPPNWRWWLRLHPSDYVAGVATHPIIEPLIDRANVVWGLSNELPLPILLEFADVHVTKSSSSTIEAREYRIPTVFYDRDGFEYYRGLPRSGEDVYAERRDFIKALDAVPRRRRFWNNVLRSHARRVRLITFLAALTSRRWTGRLMDIFARVTVN